MSNMWVGIILNVLAACFTVAICGEHPDGVSKVSRAQDALGNYQFSYAIRNPEGEHFRKEGTDSLGRVVGSYGLTQVDGRQRVVDYVADKDGFRAEVRSNEPGVAIKNSGDAMVVRTGHDLPLSVAASQDSREVYGTRLKTASPRVDYVETNGSAKKEDTQSDNLPRESRQRNFDDYRPRSPVAYYPGEANIPSRPLNLPDYHPGGSANPRTPNPTDARSLDVYFPPLDPHTAVRRPPYYLQRDRGSDSTFYQTTTSRRPFVPPYGGFDDEPLPVGRRPGISMSTIHGGIGTDHFLPSPAPTPSYGPGRYPSVDTNVQRNFGLPRYPLNSNFPTIPRHSGGVLQSPPQNTLPGIHFNPPNYDNGIGPPNVVLRAVPIPNGIQAVRVDPSTGEVYERLTYPLFLRPDGYPAYDRNILLHNDDFSDDHALRRNNAGYLDVPFPGRPIYRGARNQPFDNEGNYRDRARQYNRSYTIDEKTLSNPSARDLAWIHRQLSLVEGFNRNRSPNGLFSDDIPRRSSGYSGFDDFDDTEDKPQFVTNVANSDSNAASSALFDQSNYGAFSRIPRHSEKLSPADTKELASVKGEKSESDPKQSETSEIKSNNSEIEKE